MAHGFALGLEFSTQSAKAVVLDLANGTVEQTFQLTYDDSFPDYGTRGGVLPSADPAVRHTSPAMLAEALEELFRRMRTDSVDLSRVEAVKLDAQQHCTVYVDASFPDRLTALDPARPLAGQLKDSFSRESAPIWEDRSTEAEARLLEQELGGSSGITRETANRAELRFPASQMLKWGSENPADYDATSRVYLLSAFMTSVLAGRDAPVDTGDGWGTNLNSTDIQEPGWNERVLSVIDGKLNEAGARTPLKPKLGAMSHYDAPVGPISRYFAEAFGVNPEAVVLSGTGDNPATLLGCGGNLVISLGSSYTVNGILAEDVEFAPAEYNVFGYIPGRAMALSVITNGTKVHDEFRRSFAGGASWDDYAAMVGSREVRADEPLLLPYVQDESVPTKKAGIVRDGLDSAEAAANIRALHLSQALSLRLHASHVSEPHSLTVVGGGSHNEPLRQFITDAFGATTYCIRNGDFAAPLGCAIAAARYALGIDYEETTDRFVQAEPDSYLEPRVGTDAVYRGLIERYAALEASA